MTLHEIPTPISEVARVMLQRDEERIYFISTVDQMRYGMLNGVHVSTSLLNERFRTEGRARITACLKECVSLGLLTCDGRYKPQSPGNPGFSKTYCIAQHLLKPQGVAVEEVSDAIEEPQHRDGPSSPAAPRSSAAAAIDLPIARCVHPAYVSFSDEESARHREKMAEAMERLGWDCCKVNVLPKVAPSLVALECPITDADVAAYFHTKEYRKSGRRAKVRFNARTGQYEQKIWYFDAETQREMDIQDVRRLVRNLVVGKFHATRRNGRCYHTATDLPTEFRRQCRFRMPDGTSEAAVDVDVSSMHWWLLSTMINDDPEHAEERQLLVEVFAAGGFYEFLRDRLAIFGANLSEKELCDIGAFKKAVNAFILFGSRNRRGSFQIAFREALPGMAGVLRTLHSHYSLRQLSFILTRLEGVYTLDYVMTMMHDAGIPCLPYHDGCLVPESAVQKCIDLYRQAMILVHGNAPLIRAKGQGMTSEHLEAAMWDEDSYFDPSELA